MKWKCTPFESFDLPNIGLFFKKQFKGIGDYGSMSLFHWKINQNYAEKGLINIVKDGSTIASTTSITPKKLLLNGEVITCAEIGDTYTDENYQRQGLFSLLINQSRSDANEKGIEFIYGTPNHQSLPGYEKRANFKVMPNLNVLDLSLMSNIQAGLQRKLHWTIASFIGCIYNISVFAKMMFGSLLSSTHSLNVDLINELPSDWNEFWEKAKAPYDFIFNRNQEGLTWRYFESPNKYHFYRAHKNNTTVGYIVYRWIFDEKESHLVIADFLFLPGQEALLLPTLHKTMASVWRTHFFKVKLWCVKSSPYMSALKKFGFKINGPIPVICHQSNFVKEFDKCNTWHFSISDSDNI